MQELGRTRGREYFEEICAINRIEVSPTQLELLEHYVSLLRDYTSRINLISRKDEDDLWRNHLLHSAALLTQFTLKSNERYFDLGTGGGLPGIPLAILHRDSFFVLCDSIRKKINAVEEVRTRLGLRNVQTLCARVEDASPGNMQGKFCAVFARAVTELKSLSRFSQPLLDPKKERMLIAWKGGDISKEIDDAKELKTISSIGKRIIHLESESYFKDRQKYLVYVRFKK